MSDMAFMVVLHAIAATPPTIAAVAALVTALRTQKRAEQIHVLVNGERSRLMAELAQARAELEQRKS